MYNLSYHITNLLGEETCCYVYTAREREEIVLKKSLESVLLEMSPVHGQMSPQFV